MAWINHALHTRPRINIPRTRHPAGLDSGIILWIGNGMDRLGKCIMKNSKIQKGLRFEGPACYHIVVQGELNDSWVERLGDLKKTGTHSEHGLASTTLKGLVRDQTQLNGILDTLYSLHLPILMVERAEDEMQNGEL